MIMDSQRSIRMKSESPLTGPWSRRNEMPTFKGSMEFIGSKILIKFKSIERIKLFRANLGKSQVEIIEGAGTFIGDRKVAVGQSIYSADHVLIAVGGFPTWPNVPGAELGISSDGFFELESLPKYG